MTYFKHESAYVGDGCEIGDGTKIWHFCHVQTSGAGRDLAATFPAYNRASTERMES